MPVPADPTVTLLRMRMIAEQAVSYRITGMACADILAPHCGIVLYTLTRGMITVVINGERSQWKWAANQKDGHENFAVMQGELRRRGPVRLRHIND